MPKTKDDDLYERLGVPRDADEAAIKKAEQRRFEPLPSLCEPVYPSLLSDAKAMMLPLKKSTVEAALRNAIAGAAASGAASAGAVLATGRPEQRGDRIKVTDVTHDMRNELLVVTFVDGERLKAASATGAQVWLDVSRVALVSKRPKVGEDVWVITATHSNMADW